MSILQLLPLLPKREVARHFAESPGRFYRFIESARFFRQFGCHKIGSEVLDTRKREVAVRTLNNYSRTLESRAQCNGR